MNAALVAVSLVAILRLAEIAYSRHNERLLHAEGGFEVGRAHYPLILLFHTIWLVVLAAAAVRGAQIQWFWLGLFVLLQPLRAWTILSLGRFWTARVITLPAAPLVRRGPYRLIRHPNYLIVELEIVILPLALGLWTAAMVFGLVNAGLLAWRIKVEGEALSVRRAIPAD